VHAEASPRAVEINVYGVVRYRDGPEDIVRVDVRVVVMNLLREDGRSDWTGEEIESNKGERAFMVATIGPDELPLIEAHVRLERQGLGLP
jgi:hypothetical protein